MYDNVNLTELHCHIGSQIFDIDPFVTAAEIMLDFMGKIHDELGIVISELNLGGGFGIMYTKDDEPVPYENYMEKVSEAVKARLKNTDFLFRISLLSRVVQCRRSRYYTLQSWRQKGNS